MSVADFPSSFSWADAPVQGLPVVSSAPVVPAVPTVPIFPSTTAPLAPAVPLAVSVAPIVPAGPAGPGGMAVLAPEVVSGTSSSVGGSNGHVNGSAHNMVLSAHGPTTIVVTGSSTKEYIDHLKKLGGSWNPGFQAWTFDVKYQQELQNFVNAVTAGKIKPDPSMNYNNKNKKPYRPRTENTMASTQLVQTAPLSIPTVPVAGGFALPTVEINSHQFQRLDYNVFKPLVGMLAKIKQGTATAVYSVVQVENNEKGKTDVAYIKNGEKVSKLEVTNGHWQVRGWFPEHRIFFENAQ